MIQPNKIGNAFHVISSVSVLAYTVTAILFAKPGGGIFDNEWVQHGFCVIQKDIPYWNTHDLCLYLDTILVAVGFLIYHSLKGLPIPAMKSADSMMVLNLLGHLGHGVAHGFIAANYRGDNGNLAGVEHLSQMEKFIREGSEEMDPAEIVKKALVGTGFWFGLLRGILPKVEMTKLAIVSILVNIGGWLVTDVLGFAYVQAILAMAFTSTQLKLPKEEKEFSYAAFAATSFVLSLIPWVESMACESFAAKMGGHLMYDAAIPILIIASYCASWYHYSGKVKEKKI